MAILPDKHLNLTAYSIGLLSALLLAAGSSVAMVNPQIYTRADLKVAHAAGRADTSIPARLQDNRPRIFGVLTCLLGLGGVAIAATLAQPDQKALAPASVAVTGSSPVISPETSAEDVAELIAACKGAIHGFLAEHKLIRSAYTAKGLILVGDQGTGKSSLGDQLCQFRQVCKGDRMIVADPHYHLNKGNGLWATADRVLGSATEIKAHLLDEIYQALNTPREDASGKKNPRVTVLLDEFSKWHTKYDLEQVATEIMEGLSQDIRKSVLSIVVIAHGDEKGMLGSESLRSGLHKSVVNQCAVVNLTAQPSVDDEEDDPTWTGLGNVSLRGADYESGKRSDFQLPSLLHPRDYASDIGRYIRAAVDAVRPKTAPASAKRTATDALTDAAKRWRTASPVDEERYSNAWTDTLTIDDCPAALNGDRSDWEAMYEIERAESFCRWISTKHSVTKGQELPVPVIRDNWAKHQGLNTEQTVEFLMSLNRCGLGRFDGHMRKWISRVDASSILLSAEVEK